MTDRRTWSGEHEAAAAAVALAGAEVLSLAMRAGRMGVWSRDLATDRVWWSRELEGIFGVPPGGFAGTEEGFLALLREGDRDLVTRAVEESLRTGREYVVEFRFRHASGEWRWMEGRGGALRGPEGRPAILYGIGIDITERKAAEREHAFSTAIIASSNDAIVTKTLEGVITSWNEAAQEMFGYAAEEAVGQRIDLIVPPDRMDEEREIINRLRRGERVEHYETVRVSKAGALIDVSLTISPVKNASGEIIGASKVARDITERKRAEAEREELLAREQEARARAEETSRLKDEFLATLSHELRTPLNAILGWARLLREGALEGERAREAAEIIERNAETQASLIEDLLDVSRIISGKLRLNVRTIWPAAIVESALESVRLMAEAKQVRLQSLCDPAAGPISGDASRLQQVVWNLLSNAIKFTPPQGRVRIRVERIDSHVEIMVSDNGQGIGAQFLPHVFERFRQADSSFTRTNAGLGLGLAIVRHLVELHGGTVTADSPGEGKGATFTVRIPVMTIRQEEEDDAARTRPRAERPTALLRLDRAPDLAGVRVLVVDDEPDARAMLREVLTRRGAEVREAPSAQQGLEELKRWRPTILVSDIGMPARDGYAFISDVRDWEGPKGSWTPAVALTAYARPEDRVRALLAGYQAHVAKPVEPLEFLLVVARLVPPERRTGRSAAGL